MSLEYYLFCRRKYDDVISNLDNIIDIYESLNNCTTDEYNSMVDEYNSNVLKTPFELYEPDSSVNFFINKKKHILKLKKICDAKINVLCKHDFETDTIDISPDRSQNITYCKVCGFTK